MRDYERVKVLPPIGKQRRYTPPPSNIVMWRGMSRLDEILLGLNLGAALVDH
jgi:hypothetical protein